MLELTERLLHTLQQCFPIIVVHPRKHGQLARHVFDYLIRTLVTRKEIQYLVVIQIYVRIILYCSGCPTKQPIFLSVYQNELATVTLDILTYLVYNIVTTVLRAAYRVIDYCVVILPIVLTRLTLCLESKGDVRPAQLLDKTILLVDIRTKWTTEPSTTDIYDLRVI